MSVQRYRVNLDKYRYNDPLEDALVEHQDGEFVLFKDYAALEARCAGLERERDKLQRHYDRCRCTVMDLEQQRDVALDERDALQAKLAALIHAIKSHCKGCRTEVACGECFLGLVEGGGK